MFAPHPPASPSESIVCLILIIISGTTMATQLFYVMTKPFQKNRVKRVVIINSVCAVIIGICGPRMTPQWSAIQHQALVAGILILANGTGFIAGFIENRIQRKEK